MDQWERELQRSIVEDIGCDNYRYNNYYNRPPLMKNNNDNMRFVLVGGVVLLAFFTLFLIGKNPREGGKSMYVPPTSYFQQQPSVVAPETNKFTKIENKLVELDQNSEINTTRVWLLAIANNENAYIKKYNTGEDFLTIGAGWKLNRMPTHVDLTLEQRRELEKHVQTS